MPWSAHVRGQYRSEVSWESSRHACANACLASPAIRRISECERGLAARANHETKGHVANGMQIRVFLENCLCLNVCGYLALMH